MRDMTSTSIVEFGRSLLYVAEFQHRTNNEYATVISFVSRLAALSSAPEAKDALLKVIDHLHATSKVQYALRPPIPGVTVDFAAQVEELCDAFASAGLEQRGIKLHLEVSGSAMLDAMRSWRASLIISELMTNSLRHACSQEGSGTGICVAIGANGADVLCRITDNGRSAGVAKPGVGSRLIDALAEELRAQISRSYTEQGAAVTLCFPISAEVRRNDSNLL